MKVQTKIVLLLALVVAIFLGGLWTLRSYERRKFRQIGEERFRERLLSFETFLNYHGQSLETLVKDSTLWDQMVNAIGQENRAWLEENTGSGALDAFHANAIWIYRPDGSQLFTANNLSAEEAPALPISPEALQKIFAAHPLSYFFVKVPQGIMEVRGGSVHPSKDFARQTPAAGFLFAGRLWSQPELREMSLFTGNDLSLRSAGSQPAENSSDEKNAQIVFSRTLKTWNSQPLAELVIRNDSPVIRELNRSSERLLLALVLFSLVLLLLLATSLVRWVSRPLHRTMESLQRNDPAPLQALTTNSSEFGKLARTIEIFFRQRDNLLREMEERRATEEALRKSEEELRHSQKMEAVGRLAGGIAHDFNNLLTAIIGYADLINARNSTDDVVRQQADLIHKAGEQAAGLTRQLLAFSRKQLLQPKVIDLNQLVVDMEKLLRRVIGERFELLTQPDAALGTVMADPSQIEQVILNLGVNARDAMPKGGRLVIRTNNVHLDQRAASQIATSLTAGDYVELSVADAGVGMDEATKARIFEPFFTTKGPGKGTGLGLATVYGIVRQTGGGISVESAEGKGSTFRIYFPLERAPADHLRSSTEPWEKAQTFETILVVEDEDIVRELVCDVLSEQGYSVLSAEDGVQALRLAEKFEGHIHLLLTDVIMPHMNGPELAEKLSALRPETKVLFVTGYSDNDIGHHGVLDPGIELLQKPFTPHSLSRKVRDVMEDRSHVPSAST